jgi:hypothetical protein
MTMASSIRPTVSYSRQQQQPIQSPQQPIIQPIKPVNNNTTSGYVYQPPKRR